MNDKMGLGVGHRHAGNYADVSLPASAFAVLQDPDARTVTQ
jgi:hypothetical protein